VGSIAADITGHSLATWQSAYAKNFGKQHGYEARAMLIAARVGSSTDTALTPSRFSGVKPDFYPGPRNKKGPVSGAFPYGRYWARTSDPQLVELVLSQLS
jgi:hypothetical protein